MSHIEEDSMGVWAYDVGKRMPCGHGSWSVATSSEGTNYCQECERIGQLELGIQSGEEALRLARERADKVEAEVGRLGAAVHKYEQDAVALSWAIGSPKDVDRLPEVVPLVLASYRSRAEQMQAELEQLRASREVWATRAAEQEARAEHAEVELRLRCWPWGGAELG